MVNYAHARGTKPMPAWYRQARDSAEARRVEQEDAKPECAHAQATMLPLLELAISMHHLRWKQARTPMSWVIGRAHEAAQVVAEKGDVLQFGGKGCAEAFVELYSRRRPARRAH